MHLIPKQYLDDHDLKQLFIKLEDQGLNKTVFYDGSVKTPETWLSYVKKVWLIVVKDDDGLPMAVFWLNDFSGKIAFLHFWVYREAWHRSDEIAEQAFIYIKEQLKCVLTGLLGRTPATNHMALGFAQRNGFNELCRVPEACNIGGGRYVEAVITYKEL